MTDKEEGSSFVLEDERDRPPLLDVAEVTPGVESKPVDTKPAPLKSAKKKKPPAAEEKTEGDIQEILEGKSHDDEDLLRISERIKHSRGEDEDAPKAKGHNQPSRTAARVADEVEHVQVPGCPPNGVVRGKAPPNGNEQWCEAPGPDGTLLKEGVYSRWDDKGTKRLQATYRAGKLNGVFTSYYVNGSIEQEKTYRNGEVAGIWARYNKNGTKEVEIGVLNGKRNGRFARWDKRGNLQIEGSYANDQRSGLWTVLGKGGQPRSKISYRNGKKEGKAVFYYANGQIMKQGNFVNDRPDGNWQQFSKNGRPQAVRVAKKRDATGDDAAEYSADEDSLGWKPM